MRTFSVAVRTLAVAAVGALAITSGVRAAGVQSGIDLANLDRSCKACTDFYQFADGGWIKNHPIPAAYPAWGNFQELAQRNQAVLHGILEHASTADAPKGSNEQKIGDFYASCMNEAQIESAGTTPIAPLLDVASAATPQNIGATLATLQQSGVNAFFDFGSNPDFKNSTQEIASVDQGGLGLPDREYYLSDNARMQSLRTAYQAHVEKMFALLGDTPEMAKTEAAAVMSVETTLAKNQISRVAERDPANIYHRMTFGEASALAPALQFASFFTTSGVSQDVPVNVAEPGYLQTVNALVATMPADELHAYLRWHVVHAYAFALPKAFVDANFDFYGTTMQGTQEQLPRWKRCVASTDRALGEALGQFYVKQTFPPSAKANALAMVKNIKAELRDDFSTLSWMTPQTRARAVAKLDAFILKIGYPDKWRDYSAFPVARVPYAQNMIASAKYESAFDLAKIGHPVDRTEWEMTPATVNAYYDPTINEIVFPAGILQPPFFNKDADMAVNYGAIGAVVGHESTHGFDDEGRKFDAQGNLVDWWTPEDAAAFNKRTQCIVKQWDALEPVPGTHEIGAQVLGEETADLGGLTIAYKAFEKWQAHHPRRVIDGFTPEQRFFLGWAQVWAANERPAYSRMLAQTDVHGFPKFRVNQTVKNMPQFAQAFFCKLNDPMVLPAKQRCQIW
jgi:putative endopeptidase